jgi:hypothetical protein
VPKENVQGACGTVRKGKEVGFFFRERKVVGLFELFDELESGERS